MVSASSIGQASAPVKLGEGSYVWQLLWQVCTSLVALAIITVVQLKRMVSKRCCTRLRQITPQTAYVVAARAWVGAGSGLAGVTFYDGAGRVLTSSAVRITATRDSSVEAAVVAPPGARFAALWAGKWDGGGELQVRRDSLVSGHLLVPEALLCHATMCMPCIRWRGCTWARC